MMKNSTLPRVLKYAFRYPVSMIGSFLFAAVTVFFSLLIPVLVGDAVDCITDNGIAWDGLFSTFLMIAVCVGISALAQFFAKSLQQSYFGGRRT